MLTGKLPNAIWTPVSYRHDAGRFSSPPLGWILHTAEGMGPLFDYFNRLRSPNRKFSTAWIRKDGIAQQYTELENKSWAQSLGNGTYWSFETEGYAREPLTKEQINTLTLWHSFLKVENKLANKPGEKGIGIHSMGNNLGWSATACPGRTRAEQRNAILRLNKPLLDPPVVHSTLYSSPTFPYSPLHYFGVESASKYCHSGKLSVTDQKYIRVFQNQLLLRGRKSIKVDGFFGKYTEQEIKTFQTQNKLSVDGKVGPRTWKKLWAI